jgi:hypothetical protein
LSTTAYENRTCNLLSLLSRSAFVMVSAWLMKLAMPPVAVLLTRAVAVPAYGSASGAPEIGPAVTAASADVEAAARKRL